MWEKQPREGSKAYEAFCIYRDMGAGRTQKAVAKILQKSYTIIHRWKVEWNWEERATAYDNEIAEAAIKKASSEYEKMLESQIKIGKMLQTKAANAVLKMNFEEATAKHLPALLEMINSGVKIERSSRDLNAGKMQNLTINIVTREKPLTGGEEV